MTEEARDTGTPELAKRRRVQPRLNSRFSYDLYVADGSGPDKLLSDGLIDTNQHATLLAFTVMMHRANMLGPKSPAMERVTNSDPSMISQKVADAMRGVSRVIRNLDLKIGRNMREQVVNLCMLDQPLANPELLGQAIESLRRSLDEAS